MNDDLRVGPAVVIPVTELDWRFSRSSGPGGQGVNTTDSRVELIWDVSASVALSPVLKERALHRLQPRLVAGCLVIVASEHRSQLRNREAAIGRLIELVRDAVAAPSPGRRPSRPSRGAKRRRLEDKRRRSEVKKMRRGDET